MSGIHAIILAAGESRRMGSPKMLLPFNGITMLEKVILNVSGSEVDDIIVVLGAYKEKLIEIVEKMHVSHCFNGDYRKGMLSSVICGIKNLPEDLKAMVIFQGDQPFIDSEVINLVIKTYLSSGKGIVIPVHEKRRGHPVVIDSRYRSEIEDLDPDKGLRHLSLLHPEDVLEVETDKPGILRDFDTYEEYISEINKLK